MNQSLGRRVALSVALAGVILASPRVASPGDVIPEAAWKRPIGQPLADPGERVASQGPGHIDDGYWQGAPVGGFGAGTFSRSYRGDFSRWHVKAGVHKYQTIAANQFAMYQKAEGDSQGVAQALLADHPKGGGLGTWTWDYPVGAGDYYALYPKSWFDYRWDKFPAHVVLEQFSPVLPDNYKESSYPVAVYRWHAENPTSRSRHGVGASLVDKHGRRLPLLLPDPRRRALRGQLQPVRELAGRLGLWGARNEGRRLRPQALRRRARMNGTASSPSPPWTRRARR